jgi:hypothetical protein
MIFIPLNDWNVPPHPSLSPVAGERIKERGSFNFSTDWNGWNHWNHVEALKTFKQFI